MIRNLFNYIRKYLGSYEHDKSARGVQGIATQLRPTNCGSH